VRHAFSAASLLFLSSSCATGGDVIGGRVYLPSEINAHPSDFVGREVRIKGFIFLSDEAHGLWDSNFDREYISSKSPKPDDPVWRHCISVEYTEMGARGIGRHTPRYLVARGKIGIAASNTIDFGACSSVYITVDAVE